jgi:hypothetical protein
MSLKYNIGSIGWFNFETLCQTLLRVVIGPGVSAFGGSKDSGRDAWYEGVASYPSNDEKWDGTWLFQVKFVDLDPLGARGAARTIVSSLRRELELVLSRAASRRHVQADNYILLTNVPITANERDELTSIAGEYLPERHFAVVDGREICEFLDIHRDVRRSYPQLLALADLDVIINADVLERSKAYLDSWQLHLQSFVSTDAYRDSLEKLREHHFVVLDGAPEVGKTTIAAALALQFAATGFEILDVTAPDQVFRMYRSDKSQVFISDDVVGSIALNPNATEQWSRDFGAVFSRLNPKHLMVWTGRTYVLGEAIAQSRLGDSIRAFPGIHKVQVTVAALGKAERVAMLFNHAKLANLAPNAKALLKREARRIVESDDFTPERVRQLTADVMRDERTTAEDIRRFFSNPTRRWEQAISKLGHSERALLQTLLFDPSAVQETQVELRYSTHAASTDGSFLPFSQTLDRLSPGFLRRVTNYQGEVLINFQHPSIRDVLIGAMRNDSAGRRLYFELATPAAIAGIARGMSALALSEEDAKHSIVPQGDSELAIVIARIRALSANTLSIDGWREMLIAALQLIPSKRSIPSIYYTINLRSALTQELRKVRMPASELDLQSYGSSPAGKLVNVITTQFAGSSVFSENQSYTLAQWSELLELYGQAVMYSVPLPHVSYLPELIKRCAAATLDELAASAEILQWVRRNEPMVYRQFVSTQQIDRLQQLIEDWLESLMNDGQKLDDDFEPEEGAFPDGDEHAEWAGMVGVASHTASILAKLGKQSDGVKDLLEQLDVLNTKLHGPPDADDDDRYDGEGMWPSEYWTVERVLEDL